MNGGTFPLLLRAPYVEYTQSDLSLELQVERPLICPP